MTPVEALLLDLDRIWKPVGGEPNRLRVLGSVALMLQVDYRRATKDGDVLETTDLSPAAQVAIKALAGKGSKLFNEHRVYLEVVPNFLPLLPRPPLWHPHPGLTGQLKNFTVEVLDITDVAVSKLKRFNANDQGDILAMVERGHLDRDRLVARFQQAVDCLDMDGRADQLDEVIANLHQVEQDYFLELGSDIRKPDWLD